MLVILLHQYKIQKCQILFQTVYKRVKIMTVSLSNIEIDIWHVLPVTILGYYFS